MIPNEFRTKFLAINVLIVDDDEKILEAMAHLLKRYFNETFTAPNAHDAIELYQMHAIDIVLADVTMPVMNGIQMAKHLKEHDERLKILFITGHNEESYSKKFTPFGNFVLTKPISKITLLETIDSLLQSEQPWKRTYSSSFQPITKALS